MENRMISLSRDDSFQFACGPQVPCFNACCRDLNQVLTPYDILRLKTRLGLSSGEFLARYTVGHLGPQTGLPVICLKAVAEEDLRCPFVTEAGCRVYEDRPSSCRIYPLARAITRSRDSGAVTEHFALLREDHCRGCAQPRLQTVNAWVKDQALAPYNRFNDMLMEIIRLKNQLHPASLDFREQRLFRMSLYDLDDFRRYLADHGLPQVLARAEDPTAEWKADDAALLTLGHAWLQWALFGENQPL